MNTGTMQHGSLYERSLAEQRARNENFLAAITACRANIADVDRLASALASRGLIVSPSVSTLETLGVTVCRLHLWLTCARPALADALEWLNAEAIGVERHNNEDGPQRRYALRLRACEITLHVQLVNSPGQCAKGAFA